MAAIPDRWNPRLWLRDWLNKPSLAQIASHERLLESIRSGEYWKPLVAKNKAIADAHALVESARRVVITQEIRAKAEDLLKEAGALGLTTEQYVAQFPERAKIDRTTRPDAPPPTPAAAHPASPGPSADSGESQ